MAAMFRTIVGARDPRQWGPGRYPRGIEVLLKKAKVDVDFRAQFLENPVAAAALIGLGLRDSEKRMLASAATSALRLMIEKTFVPRHHVGTFMSRNVSAMLAVIIASTVAMKADGCAGVESEDRSVSTGSAVLSRIEVIQSALEAYLRDRGSYPSTEAWMTVGNPLEGYVSSGGVYDTWGRKFHYQARVKDGKVIGYCLQSWGENPLDRRDDIVAHGVEHRFPLERPLTWRDPQRTKDARIVFRADHKERNRFVEWYLDDKLLAKTAGTHEVTVPLSLLGMGGHDLLAADDGGHYAMMGIVVERNGSLRYLRERE